MIYITLNLTLPLTLTLNIVRTEKVKSEMTDKIMKLERDLDAALRDGIKMKTEFDEKEAVCFIFSALFG